MRSVTVLILLLNFTATAQQFEGRKKLNGTDLYLSIQGKGEPVVVIHGGPGLNHHYFKPYLNALEKKFKVVYYDQRASGSSSIPSMDSISYKFFADDLEAIRKELNVKKLNLLAHSWGAVVAVHYALAYPDRVNKIIFSNPALLSREFDGEARTIMKKRISKEDSTQQAAIFASSDLMDSKKYDKLMRISFRTSAYDKLNMSKLDLNIPANFMVANKALFGGLMKDPAAQANLYDSLKSFRFPVLIIHGEADIVPEAALKKLKQNLPKAEFIVFKKSGHFPFVEETEKFTAIVNDFLKRKK